MPSPYQRDLFRALARRPEVRMRVYYLEASRPDSPWPEKPLENYETVLPGGARLWKGIAIGGTGRSPEIGACDFIVVNSLMSFTAQWLMRGPLRRKRSVFGESVLAAAAGFTRRSRRLCIVRQALPP